MAWYSWNKVTKQNSAVYINRKGRISFLFPPPENEIQYETAILEF